MKRIYLLFSFLLTSIFCAKAQQSDITFHSSDTIAENIFKWAKNQALHYAHFNEDPVGDWYEASILGRESFCMRDMIHQSVGAHMLGLDSCIKNMLHKIAEGISDSKDWCSYWEINRYGLPTPVDYVNDHEFWYALPANFDFIDCCYRMFIWTGDRSYLTDPVFLNFYTHTVYDYVDRWDLGIDKILKRSRIMNVGGTDNPRSRYYQARGIPGYDETNSGFNLGVEQLAIQYSGYLAYARIQQYRGDTVEADKFLVKAGEIHSLLNTAWWDSESQTYYFYLDKDRKLVHGQPFTGRPIVFWEAADPSKMKVILDTLDWEVNHTPRIGNIYQSQICMELYRYGYSETAYDLLKKFTRGRGRTYPEMSFTAVEAIISGMMGIEIESHPPSEAMTYDAGHYIVTTPRLGAVKGWASVDHLRIQSNDIGFRHEGSSKTIFTNHSGPGLIWKARFKGYFDVLFVDGYSTKARKGVQYPGGPMMSWVTVEVAPGETVTVKTYK